MSVKHSIFIALFGIVCQLHANALPNSLPNIQATQFKGGPCNDPAPANFHIVSIGPTWVDLAWISANPLNWHRIKTYKTSNNLLVSNLLLPPGSSATVNGLDPDEAYYSRINVVCDNGYDSDNYAEVQFTTVILDLIVIGYEGIGNNPQCTIRKNVNYTCNFPANGSVTNFKFRLIDNPSQGRKFDISKQDTSTLFHTTIKNDNVGQGFVFLCDNQNPDAQGSMYQIKSHNLQILFASFTLSYAPGTSVGLLTCTNIMDGFEIVRFEQLSKALPTPEGGDRSNPENKANDYEGSSISVAPNPFSDSFMLTLGERPEGEVKIQLFNLSGQKVLEQQYEPGQEQYTLRTIGLPPGFYMLRVEADGEVQNLKVVKSE
ncbi:MAG: T9SS type A sorting domain-containing protein [Phycisphaerae bacterium]|nr:T9SS type A sorting domain-containing protein [Saprospiraceae bacterium]